MARRILACLLLITAATARDQTRWSRQISSYTSDLSDWVPLPGPIERDLPPQPHIKRQAIAEPRILAEPVFPGFSRPTGFSQDFPSRTYFNSPSNRQLYLQSVPAVPSAPQNYLTDQGFRFGLSQPNYPLNQGFLGPQMPQLVPFEPVPPIKQRPVLNPVAFPKPNLPSPQAKPFVNPPKKQEIKPNEGRGDNISFPAPKKPQSLQKLKYETYDKVPKTEMVPPKAKSEREEVQLLYVPLESLHRGQFNFRSPLTTHIINQNSQNVVRQKQTFTNEFKAPQLQNFDTFEQDPFSNFNSQFGQQLDQAKFSTVSSPFPTTLTTPAPKSKKLKPHQPPLAIFMTQETTKGNQVKVGDVLSMLKNSETIAVLDSVNPQSAPKVFIGPSTLNPPENFVKFELPYLSNIEHSDKKLRSLPFFVAPLSYKTPQGFAKIPFPSPHVGSVIINSEINKPTTTIATPAADVIPNSYSSPQPKPVARPVAQPVAPVVTQKPSFTFYSTAPPKTIPTTNPLQSNYYTFEPQTVSTLRTPPREPGTERVETLQRNSYFINKANVEPYGPNPIRFETNKEPVKAFNIEKQTQSTTARTTVPSSTTKSSTYPSQLLETHNPYSINQAFHFSTPLDYHNLYEENYATPGPKQDVRKPAQPPQPPQLVQSTPSSTTKALEPVTEKQNYQTTNYAQNYSPEIQYESEIQNSRYNLNSNEYTTKPEDTSYYRQQQPLNYNQQSLNSAQPTQYSNPESQLHIENTDINKSVSASVENEPSSKSPYVYNQYESYDVERETAPSSTSSSTSTTTTTTTRRSPTRGRGRPRYTTTPRSDSGETPTKSVVTRRPMRERRPLPNRTKYEQNKITTERATRRPVDSNENTTKYSRNRTRGRIHFRPSDSDDYYGKTKQSSSKENDLAYQRDVLHQNYPVTLMERSSTVDIDAITEPVPRISSTRDQNAATEVYDTENADTNDNRAISPQFPTSSSKEDIPNYTSRIEEHTEPSFISKISSTRDDYSFQSRSSFAPVDAIASYDDVSERDEDIYVRPTTPAATEKPEVSYATETSSVLTEQNYPSSVGNDYPTVKQDEDAKITTPEIEITKITQVAQSQSVSQNDEPEENVVQTTPSYNRVRVRPGVIRQHYQVSTTESSRIKTERTRRPVQAVTYRPAFNNRRTTMRIEEIEADLKTKQIHARPEVQDYRHPVYKPEPTTEPTVSTGSQDTTTKRGVFRRRRPSYSTTVTSSSTEAYSTKKPVYEVKSRFRGRRPTEKPTEKSEVQTEQSTPTTSRYNRYSNRQRLSERYNKKPEYEDSEDQDTNYSINIPKYAEAETEQWSSKYASDSFKPYNPNDIVDDEKLATTELKSNGEDETDIITARNEYDDVLISVTPASNNRGTKKIPDIPPTLEAFVEQSKGANNDSADGMSTFETMLEEVMKSLEEQDEDEYSTKVMKHKGGEIGEIPPERIITSGDNYKSTTVEQQETTTVQPVQENTSQHEDDHELHSRRRGFWKKVKVRPVTESIEAAESQYYTNKANRLSHTVTLTKTVHDKNGKYDKPRVTTYKPPAYQILNDFFDNQNEEDIDVLPTVDIPKLSNKPDNLTKIVNEVLNGSLDFNVNDTTDNINPGDMDLGTGTPDPTLDAMLVTTPIDATTTESSFLDKVDGFSFMDYLFGTKSEDRHDNLKNDKNNKKDKENVETNDKVNVDVTEQKVKHSTTESAFVPEELTTAVSEDDKVENVTDVDIKKLDDEIDMLHKVIESTESNVETSSISSFMDPSKVVSTSMSTEISHETEICFKGKCIKTSKDFL